MTTLFKNEQARATIEAGYAEFLARLPGEKTTRTLKTRHGETHVLITGKAGAKPLVVLHGALASSAHICGELGPLLDQYRIIAPDVIGQSVKSADRHMPLDTPAYAEWLCDVLDELAIDRANIYAVSWGGFVARKLAEHAPHRIDKLALLVPAGFVNGSAWKGTVRMMIPLTLFRMFPSEARGKKLLSEILTTQGDHWEPYMLNAFQCYKLDMRIPPLAKPEAFAQFDRPTLVVAADDDLSFPGAALIARVKELLPNAETELLENCKHSPPTDDAFRKKLGARVHKFFEGG